MQFLTLVFVSAFIVGFASVAFSVYLAFVIVRLVQERDPPMGSVLTGDGIPVIGRLMWMDPVRFLWFVHKTLPDDPRLRIKVRQFRRTELVVVASFVVFMTAMRWL